MILSDGQKDQLKELIFLTITGAIHEDLGVGEVEDGDQAEALEKEAFQFIVKEIQDNYIND